MADQVHRRLLGGDLSYPPIPVPSLHRALSASLHLCVSAGNLAQLEITPDPDFPPFRDSSILDQMEDLETLYRQADYVIDDAGMNFTIRIDGQNPELRAVLNDRQARTWAFLTAYNPLSQPASPEQNFARQAELVRLVGKLGYQYLHGYGTGENWPPEASLFILDIPRDEAISLAQKFHQSAILWGEVDKDAELVWCEPRRQNVDL